MLTELCQELRNWFDRDHEKWAGKISISNNILYENGEEIIMLDGQHFRIIGSLLNDGVYQYPATTLNNEEFTGAVWSMGIPPAVVELADKIKQWKTDNKSVIDSPYQSESFGGYSYSKGSGSSSGSGGNAADWKSHFSDDLNRWRKL